MNVKATLSSNELSATKHHLSLSSILLIDAQ